MTKAPNVKRFGALLVAALLAAGCGACSRGASAEPQDAAAASAPAVSGYHGALLPAPLAMPQAVLTDMNGRPFRLRKETKGRLTLVLFGYTNCPDICPVHLANLTAALREAGTIPRNRMRVLFITTDPARDTPARLRSWMSHFDPTFIGLTAPDSVLVRLQEELKLPVAKKVPGTGDDYAVGHAAQVLAFTSDGLAHLAYPFGTRQQDWVDDLPRLMNEQWGASSDPTPHGRRRTP